MFLKLNNNTSSLCCKQQKSFKIYIKIAQNITSNTSSLCCKQQKSFKIYIKIAQNITSIKILFQILSDFSP